MKTEVSWDTTPYRLINTSGVSEEPAVYKIRVIQEETTVLRKEAADSSVNLVVI
jgi:hypothetical protein